MKRSDLANAYTPIPNTCYNAMMQAANSVQEETVVKRKVSAIAAIVAAAVLLTGIAIAAITLENTGEQILEIEQTQGYYENWTGGHKIDLVRALTELGYVPVTPEVKQLLEGKVQDEAEINRIADEALVAFTGKDVSEICFWEIMIAAWGPFDDWSAEEQAWSSQLMVDLGIQRDGLTLYVLPEGGIDEQTAVRMAREAIAKGFGVDESVLDAYEMNTSFQVPEFAAPGDTQAYWYIEFLIPQGAVINDPPFLDFWVFINPDTGGFYQTVEEIIAERNDQQSLFDAMTNDPLLMEMRAYETEHNLPGNYENWSVEQFADYSKTFHERGLKKLSEHPEYFSAGTPALLTYSYGLPDDKAISQAQAQAIAEEAIVSRIGRKQEEVHFFTHRTTVLYDITDPDRPLWKFSFHMPNAYDSTDPDFAQEIIAYYGKNGERLPYIKVEINAYTGEIVRAFPYDFSYDWDSDYLGDHYGEFLIKLCMDIY